SLRDWSVPMGCRGGRVAQSRARAVRLWDVLRRRGARRGRRAPRGRRYGGRRRGGRRRGGWRRGGWRRGGWRRGGWRRGGWRRGGRRRGRWHRGDSGAQIDGAVTRLAPRMAPLRVVERGGPRGGRGDGARRPGDRPR